MPVVEMDAGAPSSPRRFEQRHMLRPVRRVDSDNVGRPASKARSRARLRPIRPPPRPPARRRSAAPARGPARPRKPCTHGHARYAAGHRGRREGSRSRASGSMCGSEQPTRRVRSPVASTWASAPVRPGRSRRSRAMGMRMVTARDRAAVPALPGGVPASAAGDTSLPRSLSRRPSLPPRRSSWVRTRTSRLPMASPAAAATDVLYHELGPQRPLPGVHLELHAHQLPRPVRLQPGSALPHPEADAAHPTPSTLTLQRR